MKEEDEESKKNKIVIYPCDMAYDLAYMEMPHVHITAMSHGLTS